ncbi:carboxypeptidase inhibitor SmCI-like [Eucyclogobius newberryi]|uniref:carboxypeptidase inhibitor SmCI-like n=1 Tax=Eucyclogobius newberryi TaxID=166745 RepID=UPI003B5CCF92
MNIPRYFYSATSQKCEEFIYGGCDGNDNRFVSERECHLHCPQRSQQMQPTERLSAKDVCTFFKCVVTCCLMNKLTFVLPFAVCHLPSESGPCDAFIPRYFYNHQTQTCEEFFYGGCLGNQNNFIDEVDCEKKCKKY